MWDALEEVGGAAENMKIRSALLAELAARVTRSGWTGGRGAQQFGLTQSGIVDLTMGRIDLFSIDMLVTMLATAGLHLDLRVHEAS